jgi:hypothetical protein
MKPPKAIRLTLKALWREFNRCSNRYPPLYHEIVTYWDEARQQLADCEVDGVCKSFRRAFADKFDDGWQEWSGPSDLTFFGRFFGNSRGLAEFQRLASSAYSLIREVDTNGYTRNEDGTLRNWGYQGWLKLLHDTAFGYPTALLYWNFRLWWDATGPSPVPRVVTPDDEGEPYPLDVFCMGLSQSVFLSSMVAIELLLDPSRAVLVGEETTGIPISFCHVLPAEQARSALERKSSVPAGDQEDIRPRVLAFDFDGLVWRLEFDCGKLVEEHSFTDMHGFHLYKKLLAQPGNRLSPDVLEEWGCEEGAHSRRKKADRGLQMELLDSFSGQEFVDRDGIKNVQRRIEEVQKEIEGTVNRERRQELQAELESMQGYLRSGLGLHGKLRKMRTGNDKSVNRLLGRLLRARQKIEIHMPRFAKYLSKTVTQRDGCFTYLP